MAVRKRFWFDSDGNRIELEGDFGGGGGGSTVLPPFKTVGGQSIIGSGDIPLPSVSGLESTSNKVTAINSSSTNAKYPSAKAVYDLVDAALGDIETALDEILGGG